MLDYDYREEIEPFDIDEPGKEEYEQGYEQDYEPKTKWYEEKVEGNYNLSLAEYPALYRLVMKDPLPEKEEKELMLRVKAGDKEAYQEFFDRNMKLVFYTAKYLCSDSMYYDYDDAIQEGMFGLMKAIELFDPAKGFKFSTYAVNWIRCYIERARSQKYIPIRVPVHLWDLSRKYYSIKKTNEGKGIDISDEELKQQLKISDETFQALNAIIVNPNIRSLTEPLNDSEFNPVTLGDTIQSDDLTPEEVAIKTSEGEVLLDSLNNLTAQEARVIKESFGLGETEAKTVRQIAQEMGISHQRVFQVRKRALIKMRYLPKIQEIAD